MKIPKIFCVGLSFCCAVLCLVSCAREPEEIGGVPVTPEMLESVSRSLAEKKETDPVNITTKVQASAEVEQSETVLPDVVYWTKSGTVYHLRDSCSALRHSDNILQGSVEEAILAEKERACKICS